MSVHADQAGKRTRVFKIKGCKSSLLNKQLLVSTGVTSLDFFLGGGVPVGSILLIEEDKMGTYSSLLLKYFLAEAVVCNHFILLASLDQQPSSIINRLPKACSNERSGEEGKRTEEGLKIAWRYEETPSQCVDATAAEGQTGHHFDLMKGMEASLLQQCHMCLLGGEHLLQGNPMHELLKVLKDQVISGGFSTHNARTPENILRIGINSFGSPLWLPSSSSSASLSSSLCQTLFSLKHLVRSSFSVCLITLPSHLFEDEGLLWRLENLADAVVALESFEGTPLQHDATFNNYHGLLRVSKSPRLNSNVCNFNNDLSNLAFKLHRKQFSIEKFCLPPVFTDDKQKNSKDKPPCSASIDF